MTLRKQIIVLALLFVAMRASRTYASYDTAESYLQYCNFTQEQTKYVIEKSNEVRNKDHFIKWIGAISAHEQGSTFIDGKTKFFAGRLKQDMKYKSFTEQVDGWATAYNKYWYKNNTASDWINRSKYCVSDTHGGGEGCPNWLADLKEITALYKPSNTVVDDNIEPLRRVVASKEPIKTTGKRCKIIYRAERDGFVQIDRLQRFLNRIRGVKKDDVVFRCYDINK